ncbi:MAG: hypothetical protein PCFJNLEI_03633 [Verrucomicrobiae bacterium]|nr:hypothetical protein [Verrucomicrobiae bacterium]
MVKFRADKLLWVLGALAVGWGMTPALEATTVSWTNTVSGLYTNPLQWSPAQAPVGGDDVFITNTIAGSIIITANAAAATNATLTISNSVAGAVTHWLLLSGNVYQVTGSTLLGSNAVVQIGSLTTAAGASTFSNANLRLADNAVIVFNDNSSGVNQLVVAGAFENSTASSLTNTGSGMMRMLFTDASRVVTNSGLMQFLSLNNTGNTNFVLAVGSGAAQGTFLNNGTFVMGNVTTGSGVSRTYLFSNQFVNAGTFVLTNGSTTAWATNWFVVTGNGSGTALTNTSTGTLKLFAAHTGLRNDMTVETGGLVNSGTLIGESTNANGTNRLTLAASGAGLHNTGWVIATNAGAFLIDAAVSGTGIYQAMPGTTLALLNGGSLDFASSLLYTGATVILHGAFTNSQAGPLAVAGNLTLTNGSLHNVAGAGFVVGAGASNNLFAVRTDAIINVGGQNILVGNGAATGNVFQVAGGVVTNVNILNVAGTATGRGTLTLSAGTLAARTLLVTNNVGTTLTNSFFSFTGGTLITSNANDAVAARIVAPANQVFQIAGNWIMLGGTNEVSNATGAGTLRLAAGSSIVVSNGAVLANNGGMDFTGAAIGRSIRVDGVGSIFSNTATANGAQGVTNTVINGGKFFSLNTGFGNSQLLIVSGPGSVFENYSANLGVGSGQMRVDGLGSGIIVTNGGLLLGGGPNVSAGGLSIAGGFSFVIVTGTGSVVNITKDGIGLGFTRTNNSMRVENGGAVFSVGGILGSRGGQNATSIGNDNSVIVTDPGSRWSSSSSVIIGGEPGAVNFTNNNRNSILVTNGGLFTTVGLLIGNGYTNLGSVVSSVNTNNSLTVSGPGSRLTNSSFLIIGRTNTTGNSANILNGGAYVGTSAGGTVTVGLGILASNNFLNIGSAGALSTFSNVAAVVVGATGANDNSILVTNARVFSGGLIVGDGGSNNTVTVLGNSRWTSAGQLGFGIGTGNVLAVANTATFTAGGIGLTGAGHDMTLANNLLTSAGNNIVTARVFLAGGSLSLGGAGGNTLALTNLSYTASAASIIGNGSSNNTLRVLNHVTWNNASSNLTVGSGAATGNVLFVSGRQTTIQNVGTLIVAASATSLGNALVISNGATVVANRLLVGAVGGPTGNSALVVDGGLLEVGSGVLFNSFTVANTISNRGGIFQFTTDAPSIQRNSGIIAITDGTVSFRAITNADVRTSAPGFAMNSASVSWNGANTFMLNAASNTTSVANSQRYTFDTGLSATNFARLEMINGHTAYRNGNITVGSGGSMLLSNTTATITGVLTNSGSLSAVNTRVTYVSPVYNSGTSTMLNSHATFNAGVINTGRWITDPTTNIFQGFGLTNTISSSISMGLGDVYVFTNTVAGTPANFVNVSTNITASDTTAGKFLFSGGLSLTQNFTVAGLDQGPVAATATSQLVATSGHPGFTANFALGTLEISNFSTVRVSDAFSLLGPGADDGLMAGLYLNNLFLGANSLLIIDPGVQVYFKNSNSWTSANYFLEGNPLYDNSISGIHQLTIIPEPSVLLLVAGGGVTILLARRRRSRRP